MPTPIAARVGSAAAVDDLRPYQREAVDFIKARHASTVDALRRPRIILAYPPVSCQTQLSAAVIHERQPSTQGDALFVTDRIVLSDQAYSRFTTSGLAAGLMQGDRKLRLINEDVLVGTAQTFARRRLDPPRLVFIDEVHYLHGWHRRMLDTWRETMFVGLTATPERKGLAKYFDEMHPVTTIAELIQAGYLVPFKC